MVARMKFAQQQHQLRGFAVNEMRYFEQLRRFQWSVIVGALSALVRQYLSFTQERQLYNIWATLTREDLCSKWLRLKG